MSRESGTHRQGMHEGEKCGDLVAFPSRMDLLDLGVGRAAGGKMNGEEYDFLSHGGCSTSYIWL